MNSRPKSPPFLYHQEPGFDPSHRVWPRHQQGHQTHDPFLDPTRHSPPTDIQPINLKNSVCKYVQMWIWYILYNKITINNYQRKLASRLSNFYVPIGRSALPVAEWPYFWIRILTLEVMWWSCIGQKFSREWIRKWDVTETGHSNIKILSWLTQHQVVPYL